MEKTKFRFIDKVLTPQNPQDLYFINREESLRQYVFIMFIGLLLILYMVVA